MMKIVKKVLKILNLILTFILLALLLLAVYGKVQMMVTKKSYVTFFGYTMFQVASNSMEPVMTVNDVILVKVNGEYKVDDIISFHHDGAIITHRVLAITDGTITVKGDANNTIDAPINKDVVIGKVSKVLPKLKVWQQILTEPKILVALFITLILFDFAFSYKGKKKKFISEEEDLQRYDKENKVDFLIKSGEVEHPKPIKQTKKESGSRVDEKKEDVVEETIEEIDKDNLSDEDLLMLTQKIDLGELNALLAKANDKEEEEITTEVEPITESDLLKLAKKIDLQELMDLLEIDKNHIRIMNIEDLVSYKERLRKMNKAIKEIKFSVQKKELIDYTIRLDLKEIQKQISKRVK